MVTVSPAFYRRDNYCSKVLKLMLIELKVIALSFKCLAISIVVLIAQVPCIRRMLTDLGKKQVTKVDSSVESSFTRHTIAYIWNEGIADIIHRSAFKGCLAPNTNVCDINTKNTFKLLDFQKAGRPLVLNFGNCT